MKNFFLLLCCLHTLISCAQNSTATEVVFTGVNVIPMTSEEILPNKTVVVKDGIITAIADEGKVNWSLEAKVIDGKGKYLMPGLAEMHAHVPQIDDLEPMKKVLLLFVANGVTTIRGMLGHPKHLELRNQINSGEIIGPRFYTSGPSANGNSVPTPQAAIELVQSQKAAGYDFIKIHPGIKLEAFQALAAEAKKRNFPFAGHVPSNVGIWNAIDLGILTIDHMDGFIEALMPGKEVFAEGAHGLFAMYEAFNADTSLIPQLVQRLKERNVWVVPTQALAVRWQSPTTSAADLSREPEMKYMDEKTIAGWIKTKEQMQTDQRYTPERLDGYMATRKALIKACNTNGVGMLLGSDAPQVFNVPGFSVHHELQYMVDAGLSAYEALKLGTTNVGKFYKGNSGRIAIGAPADLIMLEGNPLKNINNTRGVKGVMLRGRWLDKSWIDSTMKSLAD